MCSNMLQNSYFSHQLDESTGISNNVQLLAFIHFIDGDEIVTTSKGENIFSYFKKKKKKTILRNGIYHGKLVSGIILMDLHQW